MPIQLAGITRLVSLPDPSLVDAYKTGFIYTQIIHSGNELRPAPTATTRKSATT